VPLFKVGDCVIASPKDDDFIQEFNGTIIGKRNGLWVVEDQDGNAYDCDESQLESD
jgi:hypothetical protein